MLSVLLHYVCKAKCGWTGEVPYYSKVVEGQSPHECQHCRSLAEPVYVPADDPRVRS